MARKPREVDRPRRDASVSPALSRAAALSWRALVVAGAALVVLMLLVELLLVVLPVIGALLLATVLHPLVRVLRGRACRRCWPPGWCC